MKKLFSFLFLICPLVFLLAHPMPNTMLLLDVHNKNINCELQLPLKEMQFAVPYDVTKDTDNLLKIHENDLRNYILSHFKIKGESGKNWDIKLNKLEVKTDEQEATGKYKELIAFITITPKENDNIRKFTIYYDGIAHQVITHKILVAVRQDWQNGKIESGNTEVGSIMANIDTAEVPPFKINLEEGSTWKGFKRMVNLGMEHISEGTDHLLFLLVLLLSAPLIADSRKWVKTGGAKYSLMRILKVITAFTIGHSITLLIGSLGWLNPSTKWVEILIALSILVTAIHAIKPLFPNKEIYVAAGFGLIHGLAFATILSNLHLDSGKFILSLLGFNIGIELMQIFVILIIIPWLILLSPFKIYKWVRVLGALLAGIAAIAWMMERYSGKSNIISAFIQKIRPENFLYAIFAFACFTLIYSLMMKKKVNN